MHKVFIEFYCFGVSSTVINYSVLVLLKYPTLVLLYTFIIHINLKYAVKLLIKYFKVFNTQTLYLTIKNCGTFFYRNVIFVWMFGISNCVCLTYHNIMRIVIRIIVHLSFCSFIIHFLSLNNIYDQTYCKFEISEDKEAFFITIIKYHKVFISGNNEKRFHFKQSDVIFF